MLYINVYHFEQLEKRHGVLFPKYLSKNDAIFYQMLVPKILRKEVLTTCHDTRYAAHFGVSKNSEQGETRFSLVQDGWGCKTPCEMLLSL